MDYESDVYTKMECAAQRWAEDAAPQFAGDMQIDEEDAFARCYEARLGELMGTYDREGTAGVLDAIKEQDATP